jgi:hypothetical protein
MLFVAKQWSNHVMPFKITPANGTLFEDAAVFFAKVFEVFSRFLSLSFFSNLNDLFIFCPVQAA